MNRVISGVVTEQLRSHLAQSDTMASYRDDVCSRTCFCLNQDPIYLFTVLNLDHCSLYNTLKFFEVCAHTRIFPCFFFLILFIIRFIFRFLQSPFPVAYYYHLFMLMLSLAACIITPPFIFPSRVIYSTHQLPILRSLFCLLSMQDDPFITQPCFTISPDNASSFLTLPQLFSFLLLITSCHLFLSNKAAFNACSIRPDFCQYSISCLHCLGSTLLISMVQYIRVYNSQQILFLHQVYLIHLLPSILFRPDFIFMRPTVH